MIIEMPPKTPKPEELPVQIGYCPADEVAAKYGFSEGEHFIFEAGLASGAKLHRFKNPAGQEYSAIYDKDHEVLNCPRNQEKGMIDYWNMGLVKKNDKRNEG